MFENCKNLINIDLSSFTTENVRKMNNMFANCEILVNINLLNFEINHINNGVIFPGCKQLKNIIINENQIKKIEQFLMDSKIR